MTDFFEGPLRPARRLSRATPIEWSAVESDYRSGALSLRDMALKHGCSHSTIANHAGRKGWMRLRVASPPASTSDSPIPDIRSCHRWPQEALPLSR